jgi:hypothetical protein
LPDVEGFIIAEIDKKISVGDLDPLVFVRGMDPAPDPASDPSLFP